MKTLALLISLSFMISCGMQSESAVEENTATVEMTAPEIVGEEVIYEGDSITMKRVHRI